MDESKPRRAWWRRKRTWAAALLLVVAYPLSFVPACRVLQRTDPATHPFAWAVIRETHRPTAAVLMACPPAVQDRVSRVVGSASSDGNGIHISPNMIGVVSDVPDDDPADSEIEVSILVVW